MGRPRSVLVFLVLSFASSHASTFTLVEDTIGGSCRKMVDTQTKTGVTLDGTHYPGKWGITVPNLFIGTKRIDDPAVLDEIQFSLAPTTRRGASVCVATTAVKFDFRAESRVGVIEWAHGRKPDSKCAKEWARVRNVIRTHEPKHVKDVDDLVAEANARVARHAPLSACASSETAARTQVARKIVALIQSEAAAIKTQAAAKAKARDVETATMDCKACEDGLAFKAVTIDCTIETPVCAIRSGQTFSGRVCGDPTKSTWTITPHYFGEGCNLPPTGTKGDKPYQNDCVAEGSDDEKRRADTYRGARTGGAGGWMCVYRDGPTPQVVIRNFRMAMCKPSTEQTIVVAAEPTACD